MADYILTSMRGGLNNSDPALSLPDNQATVAQNVEWVNAMLAERRLGSTAVTLSATMTAKDRVTFLFRDLPTSDETAARLWAFGVTGTASSRLEFKDTAWNVPTLKDAFVITGKYPNQIRAVSLHGKTFIAYKSAQDRLHVYDGSTVRRTGLAEPGVPGVAETGVGGTYATLRYFRVRVIEKSGSTILRRSEPSTAVSITPSGTKTGIVVTQGTLPGEGETHWEIEESPDGGSNYYVVATVVIGTTTSTDTTALASVSAFTLSEDTGDYELIGSAKFLVVDDDRLVWAGNHDSATYDSRFGWTPVNGADGVGNDERFETDTDPYKDLDASEGGGITGVSKPQNGAFFLFKFMQIHKAVRSGKRTAAYDTIVETKSSGAIEGSVVDAVDQSGNPATYFIDPKVGPRRIASNGLADCGLDIRETWKLLNLDATQCLCTSLYYPNKHQVHWWIATGSSNVPDVHIVLHTRFTQEDKDGVRGGWAIWTGASAAAQAACLFASNIDSGAARSLTLVPFIGLAGSGNVLRGETGITDAGATYTAKIRSKPHNPMTLMRKFGAMVGALLAKAATGAKVSVSLVRDFGLETTTPIDSTLDAAGTETEVIKLLDSLSLSESTVMQVEFADSASPGTAAWQVNYFVMKERQEQTA